ncbi:hypothetical protein [Roseofilum sp. Guam]|nr:hypothetical protein [Roseofilum sp. Guam]
MTVNLISIKNSDNDITGNLTHHDTMADRVGAKNPSPLQTDAD